MRGFDSAQYLREQSRIITERLQQFKGGKLYLEIGGKFLDDGHASRVLPGFDPSSKARILEDLSKTLTIDYIFCFSARDLCNGRVWNTEETYEQTVLRMLEELSAFVQPRPKIAINMVDDPLHPQLVNIESKLRAKGHKTSRRFVIQGYPSDVERVVSENGYGRDEYCETDGELVVVTGLGSSCGKLSTCLGQVYLDRQRNMDSGYAKYELFPIWNLPLRHPVNLAYEAATADIGDFNAIDSFHNEAYNIESVNYNRDIDAFPILANLITKVADAGNYMNNYRSPTDMGLNAAKCGIVDDIVCAQAALQEINSRIERYKDEIGEGCEAIAVCKRLRDEAAAWLQTRTGSSKTG